VRKGTYRVPVTVDKAVWLVGEDNESTIIDAHSVGPNFLITHDGVNVTGFNMINTPTPATGSWIEQMQGIGVPEQLPNIEIRGADNCNIYGNRLTNSSGGVSLEGSSKNNVMGNEISYNSNGVRISNSTQNHVANNFLRGGGTGLFIENSANNSAINNTFTDVTSAIWLDSAVDNTLKNNTLRDNYHNFGVTGKELSAFANYVDASNSIDGKPVYYWIGRSNQTVPSDAACIVLVNCTGMTVQESVLALSFDGVILANTNSSVVKANQLSGINPAFLERYRTPGSALDILLFNSFGNQVTGNRAVICLNFSSNNILTQNTGVIRLFQSNSNEIRDNQITKISFVPIDWSGLVLRNSSQNQVIGNRITGNSAGIYLCDGAEQNYIVDNNVWDNAQGGIVCGGGTSTWRPRSNVIFRNTVTDNANQGILDSAYNTTIIGNSILKNQGNGVELSDADNCSLIGNAIEGFLFGGFGRNTRNCTIVGNNITINSRFSQYNIWFLSDYPGTFHHNNFLTPISFDHSNNVTHVWDDGSEGNYWSFYSGTDADGDGTGDTPYQINDFNIDSHPLTKPFDISTMVPDSLQ
jgi:parallel beta-helix repeat protein